MSRYLLQASYTEEGAKGVYREGATSRRTAVGKTIKKLGGELEAFYYSFGDTDAYLIVDLPDNIAAAALSMAVNKSGAVHLRTTVLLTTEEFDDPLHRLTFEFGVGWNAWARDWCLSAEQSLTRRARRAAKA